MKKFARKVGVAVAFIILLIIFGLVIYGVVNGPKSVSKLFSDISHGKINIDLVAVGDWFKNTGEKIKFKLDSVEYNVEDDMIFSKDEKIRKGNVDKFLLYTPASDEKLALSYRISGGNYKIEESADKSFYVEANNIGKLQAYVKDGTVTILATGPALQGKSNSDAGVTLYIPKEFSFADAELEIGVGKLTASGIDAYTVETKVGVGTMVLEGIAAGTITAVIEAGSIILHDSFAEKLDSDVDVGYFEFSGKVNKDASVAVAVGNAVVTLDSKFEDYNYSIGAFGQIVLNGKEYNGFTESQAIMNGAKANIKLESTLGSVKVNFAK